MGHPGIAVTEAVCDFSTLSSRGRGAPSRHRQRGPARRRRGPRRGDDGRSGEVNPALSRRSSAAPARSPMPRRRRPSRDSATRSSSGFAPTVESPRSSGAFRVPRAADRRAAHLLRGLIDAHLATLPTRGIKSSMRAIWKGGGPGGKRRHGGGGKPLLPRGALRREHFRRARATRPADGRAWRATSTWSWATTSTVTRPGTTRSRGGRGPYPRTGSRSGAASPSRPGASLSTRAALHASQAAARRRRPTANAILRRRRALRGETRRRARRGREARSWCARADDGRERRLRRDDHRGRQRGRTEAFELSPAVTAPRDRRDDRAEADEIHELPVRESAGRGGAASGAACRRFEGDRRREHCPSRGKPT